MGGDNKDHQKTDLVDQPGDLVVFGAFLRLGAQFDKALKYYEEALAINRKLGKEDKVAHYFNSIGSVYKEWGQYDKALKYNFEALKKFMDQNQ